MESSIVLEKCAAKQVKESPANFLIGMCRFKASPLSPVQTMLPILVKTTVGFTLFTLIWEKADCVVRSVCLEDLPVAMVHAKTQP